MKLDTRSFRYLNDEDWRVLTAFEMGSKNHEVVPTSLAVQLSGLRTGNGGVQRSISTLSKAGLIARVKNAKYDGYRLTYGGYDYLALNAHSRSSAIIHLGSTMGVGKESDILLVTSPSSPSSNPVPGTASATPSLSVQQSILKIHRLGRISFRNIAQKRSYHGSRSHCSWQYLSRLSAQKEHAAMTALHRRGFRVPRPLALNRHAIVMSLVPGVPLKQVPLSAFGTATGKSRDENIARLYDDCLELALSLAAVGVIHGDLNEFNILIENVPDPEEKTDDWVENEPTQLPEQQPRDRRVTDGETRKPMIPYLIDFPQITSMSHSQAAFYFDRDVRGIKSFFRKRYHFESEDQGPTFGDATSRLQSSASPRLDVEMEASGFDRKAARELEMYYGDQSDRENDEDVDNACSEEVYDQFLGQDRRLPLKMKAAAGWSI